MNNASVRQRFDLPPEKNDVALRLIREAVASGAIVAFDSSVGSKAKRYIPAWVRRGDAAIDDSSSAQD